MSLSGEQLYRQICVKTRVLANRQLRKFMEGEIPILPCSGDQKTDFIISELERLRTRVDQQEKFIKELSDALLKVRPLGGSELFVRRWGRFYADPAYCGRQIEDLHSRLHEMIKELFAARKSCVHPSPVRGGSDA
jgi:hypothetical protein